jgi:hypothetical protein
MALSSTSASSSAFGNRSRSRTETASSTSLKPCCRPSRNVSNRNATNWVVKALVDATPISRPARVSRVNADSRTSELSATLQIASVDR